jgi:hypothetical protein
MALHLLNKKRDELNDAFDRKHSIGKYKVIKVEHEEKKEKEFKDDNDNDESSIPSEKSENSEADDQILNISTETKPRGKNSCLKGIRRDVNA